MLGLNFPKLTNSKINCKTNNVEIGSKLYPSDIQCTKRLNSIIALPTSDVYRPCWLLLNKKACWVISATLVILTATASHGKAHLKSPFKKQRKLHTSTAHNLIWKELLAYGSCAYFNDMLQAVKSKKNCQLFLLDWEIPPLLQYCYYYY